MILILKPENKIKYFTMNRHFDFDKIIYSIQWENNTLITIKEFETFPIET
jgi:hypothetical protein